MSKGSAAVVVRVRRDHPPEYLRIEGVFAYPVWTATLAEAEVFSLTNASILAGAHGGEPVVIHANDPKHIEERVRKTFAPEPGVSPRVNYRTPQEPTDEERRARVLSYGYSPEAIRGYDSGY